MTKNVTPDRRVQRTRGLLQQALIDLILEKGYEAVTIQNIIDRANVGRSTFYFHFRDKEDLLLTGFEKLRDAMDAFQEPLAPGQAGWEFTLALFKHAEGQRRTFKALFGEQTGRMLLNHIQKHLILVLRKHFSPRWPSGEPHPPLDLFVQYMASAFVGLLAWWLDNDISYSADQMSEYFRALTEPTIKANMGV